MLNYVGGICICGCKKSDHIKNNKICPGFIDRVKLSSWGGEEEKKKLIKWLNDFWNKDIYFENERRNKILKTRKEI